ncbi:A/G-specific DNA-adenine glycosylase [Haloactinopolyspora alba]|uniref:Adenine DNA glycosylase n=1 Tax=Haloactinopolyspora alba TaxID=648780 RepID=A0A2P8DJY1_9ACTN|nr:A/G-specific adenine glycosylase [Haloactinopolyspora alba]PSK97532.1 A/G-specific DNA-adenine glycosylase [Haloactinopolyspora alba]
MHDAVLSWYAAHARDLPWRAHDRTPWGVLVSEVMLQQTPVTRVEPVWREWMARWPRPADLAATESGEAIRAWGRLGYPRRALRLHGAARVITERHGGAVPAEYDDLIALPGVGEYTAAAVSVFAFGARRSVLDTNVRRVLARTVTGTRYPPTAPTAAERRLADDLLPDEAEAPAWSVAVMELGAVVCTARSPRCTQCPIASSCAWRRAGHPDDDGPPRRGQPWTGTDRQARGRLMAVLREAHGPVPKDQLDAVWSHAMQRERALDGLVADGLVEPLDGQHYRLPRA